ncbi:MAG: ferric reductase-like transmembrane domain-containing protein [Actinobacteria bacterium]|nr:ferric reductase-like transmembrane domain-containing protein [Actinomycetota bacterium]
MNPQTWWFVIRASGLVAYALVGVTVVGGLLLSTRLLGRRPPPDWMLDWHRFVGGLSLVFTVLHLLSLLIDDYIEFSLVDLFVPFVATWRPVALALGILAFYMAVAVQVTSLVRDRMPAGWWRRVHHLSVPLFVLATAHLLLAGTDAGHPLVLATVGGLSAMIVLLLWFRLPAPIGTAEPARRD